jgi:ATP-binding cassette subfamily B multidrug efflux pump
VSSTPVWRTDQGPNHPGRSFAWRLRPYFRQVAGLLTIGSLAGIAMNTAVVLPAVLLGRALDVALEVQRHRASGSQLIWAVIAFAAGTAATELPRIGKRYWLDVAQSRFQANVRADALRGVLAWPMERLAITPVGDVMTRVIGDVDVLGTGVGELMVETWDSVLFSLSLVATMFAYNAELAAFALAPVPAALLLAKVAGTRVAARTTVAREAASALSSALHEHLLGVRVLRLFGRTRSATARIQRLAHSQATAEIATVRLSQGLAAFYTSVLSVGVVVIIWQGGSEVTGGRMTAGALIAFLQLFARFTGRIPRIATMLNRLQASGAAYRRLMPLLAAPPSLRGEPRWASFRSTRLAGTYLPRRPRDEGPRGPATVRAEHLTVYYPGAPAPALSDLNLDIPAGTLVAVTGPVGAGKSALARAMVGLWPAAGGRVVLDGRPLDTLDSAARAARIGYLAQEPHLFSGTVAENILLGAELIADRASDHLLELGVDIVSLKPDLAGMPDGLQTQIGELGVRVSGGQRQRMALARALAAPGRVPGLLVLDDPFSAVDVETETNMIASLRRAFGPNAAPDRRVTILLCSHRLAAFPAADVVVVLERGRISELGTHADLLAAGRLYARIYRAQMRLAPFAASHERDVAES